MAEPKTKSIQTPPYLQRQMLIWQSPEWLAAERWRRLVRQQPVAIICRDTLIIHLQALPWEIRAREAEREDELADEIEHYTQLLNTADDGDFDAWVDRVWQDALDLPVGGNTEIVRYPDGFGPFNNFHPRGHVFKILHVDGATLAPTFDPDFPFVQRHRGDLAHTVTFAPGEIGRIILSPRPELERKPYGMPPPERIYLALTMLYYGDRYYANLLMDTPEAGLLDLIDMSQDSATQWLESMRELMTGVDPFKIPVLYEHTQAAHWIPFGRPPTDMLYDETSLKYARVTAAGYWLTLSDIGLGDKGQTLSGQMRDERKARRTGFGVVREKTANLINHHILPPYLEWVVIEKDEEALVQMGRARLLNAQAMKAYSEAGVLNQVEAREQTQKDGLITIELAPVVAPALPAATDAGGTNVQNELDKVPAAQGGRGDITVSRAAALGDTSIAAVPKRSELFNFMAQTLKTGFDAILLEMTEKRLEPLIKESVRYLFPQVEMAAKALTVHEMQIWRNERLLDWFDQDSEFGDMPDVQKSKGELMAKLDGLMSGDDWYKTPETLGEAVTYITTLAYEEGGQEAIKIANSALYAAGKTNEPDVSINFDLKNPETISQIERQGAQLIRRIDDGTKYYISRTIAAGVDEGLASPKIAQLIRNGDGIEAVLKDSHFKKSTIAKVKNEVAGIMESRANSIANTEIARAETEGRIGQWRAMGLKKKGGLTPAVKTPPVLSAEET